MASEKSKRQIRNTICRKVDRIIHMALALFIITALIPFSAKASSCGHDCASCHMLTKQEAEGLLTNQAGTKVLGVENAPVKGLWQVSVEKEGEKSTLYIDYAKKNILSGSILITDLSGQTSQEPLVKDLYADLLTLDFSKAILLGNNNAKKRIAVFTDPTCPHCVMFHAEMKKIVAKHSDIAFYLFLYALDPSAESIAKSIACEKKWPLQALEDAFRGTELPAARCDAGVVETNMAYAKKNLIMSTPTIIFPNGKIHFGAISKEEFIKLLSRNSVGDK